MVKQDIIPRIEVNLTIGDEIEEAHDEGEERLERPTIENIRRNCV